MKKTRFLVPLLALVGSVACAFGVTACSPGEDGRGIADVSINASGELVISYTDGTEETLGVVVGKDGEPGAAGATGAAGAAGLAGEPGAAGRGIAEVNINLSGELVVTYTDGTEETLGVVVGKDGATGATGATGAQGPIGATGATGAQGIPGRGIQSIEYENDSLKITYTDGKIEYVELPQLHVHEYSQEWSYDDVNHWRACIVDGCNVTTALEAHTWVESDSTPATCTAEGSATYTCSVCGAVKQETLPVLGHDYGEWTIVEAPTETQTGTATRTCTRDPEHIDTFELPVLSDPAYSKTEDTADCTLGGEIIYTLTIENDDNIQFSVATEPKGHDEGAWSISKTPTTSASGTAERNCTICGAQLESVLLGVLSEASVTNGTYTKSTESEPTCTEPGIEIYTTTQSKIPGASFDFEVEVSAKGHTYELQSADPVADGGIASLQCSACGDVQSYFYNKGLTVTASNATTSTREAESGNVYFVKTAASAAISNYYAFTVTEDMIKEDGYDINFEQFTSMNAGVVLYSLTVGTTRVAAAGRFQSDFVQITTTAATSSLDGTGMVASSGNILNIKFFFTEEHVGQQVVYLIRSNTGASFGVSQHYYLMGVGADVNAVSMEGDLVLGDNPIDISESYVLSDSYVFIAPADGNYTMTIPFGMVVSLGTDPDPVTGDLKDFLDSFNATSKVFAATEGESFTFWFTHTEAGTANVNIAPGGELDDGIYILEVNEQNLVKFEYGAELRFILGDDISEGEYTLAFTGGPSMYGTQFLVSLNGAEGVWVGAYGKADDFTFTAIMKAGDVLTVSSNTLTGAQCYVTLKKVAVEGEAIDLGTLAANTADQLYTDKNSEIGSVYVLTLSVPDNGADTYTINLTTVYSFCEMDVSLGGQTQHFATSYDSQTLTFTVGKDEVDNGSIQATFTVTDQEEILSYFYLKLTYTVA